MEIDRAQCHAQCHDTCCQVKAHIKPNTLAPQDLYQLSSKGIKFAKKRDQNTGKLINDRTTIIYNENIQIKHIPIETYQWTLSGRAVLENFINFYRFKTDKASKITNDPNDFIKAHGATVLVDRIQQIIHISIQTQKLIKLLPTIDFNQPENLLVIT